MPKATMTFMLPEEREEFETALNASRYKSALWEISQRIFRPARKHGYSDSRIQNLLDKADTVRIPSSDGYTEDGIGVGTELISQLEELFYEILKEEGIEL